MGGVRGSPRDGDEKTGVDDCWFVGRRGWRVMRKSRVVNLCDNILCETFLFLVQREQQRQQQHQ